MKMSSMQPDLDEIMNKQKGVYTSYKTRKSMQ